MQNKCYNYVPINKLKREIRLVTLLPGSPGDLILCTTHIASLDDQPQYEALSYTWGDPSVTHPICLDGAEFCVTTNLLVALKHLRSVQTARVLWIDAICINQNDNDEKSWQVALMGDIYKSRSHGVMWLGEESDRTDAWCENEDGECGREGGLKLPSTSYPRDLKSYMCKWHHQRPRISEGFDLLEHLAQNKHINEIPSMATFFQTENGEELGFGEPIQAVGALCRRGWWSRIWTVQEVILPPELTLVCGSLHCKWSTFAAATDNMSAHAASCCKIPWQQVQRQLPMWTHGRGTLQGLTSALSLVAMIETRREDIYLHQYERPYFLVYQDFSFRRATDPRDRLYGLLGLYSSQNRPFEADYRVDTTELNKIANFRLLGSRIVPLYGLCRDLPQYERITVPSWMQDFAAQPDELYQSIDFDRRKTWAKYDASSFEHSCLHRGVPQICSDEVLSVVGINIGKPVVIGPVADTSPHAAMLNSIRTYSNILRLDDIAQNPYITNDGTTMKSAFFRTVLGDFCEGPDWIPRKATDTDLEKLKARVFPTTHQSPAPGMDDHALPITLSHQLHERRFFITDTFFMGMGPWNMRLEDEIWILFGSRLPFVLRPLLVDSGQARNERISYHSVLEVCYVHGIMYGEALGDGVKEELAFLK